ncbi:MAG TPA: hypothetical protein VK789_08065 [Bryobacteraceae bacterium]|jgi:hypothetical protein|nr:hypothetical protein [Bryobacteraceae bacterium]
MSWFPQIGSGSIVQFPATRSRKWRALLNELESGEQILLPDRTAGQIEWLLRFQDLTDAERSSLSALFTTSQGSFGTFTFIDPLANLLGWSEDLTQPNWQPGLLRTNAGISDPLGTKRASSISNASAGAQALQQTLGVPGDYVACFSAWIRSDATETVILQRDNIQTRVTAGPAWRRESISGKGVAAGTESTFSIALGAGQTIDVWGLQVEAQPYPSAYKQTSVPSGIFEETYFENDELTVTSTSVGLSSCEIRLMSRV